MKVLLVNGSPHAEGCTHRALVEIARTLEEEGAAAEIYHIGNEPIIGCQSCGACRKLGRCVHDGDSVNEFVRRAHDADGFVFGSAVHYASMTGAMTSFMDRAFYQVKSVDSPYTLKPAAVVASARRAGTTATLDQMMKYLTISQMPVISSSYWNMVHGFTPEDVERDLEGLQVMRTIARNMVWFLRSVECGAKHGIERPKSEDRVYTHFSSISR